MVRYVVFSILAVLLLIPVQTSAENESSFGPEVFQQRRQALIDSLGGGAALLYSEGDHTDAGYRADGLFWYFTGIDDKGAILLLTPGRYYEDILLLQPLMPEAERWSGPRPGLTDSLRESLRFDKVKRTSSLDYRVLEAVKKSPTLHLISPLRPASEELPPDLTYYNKLIDRVPWVEIRNSSHILERMRMIKTDQEVAAIIKAIEITKAGITDLLAAVNPGITEYQLDGILQESFKRHGAQHMAFPPIIGSGKQSVYLHYEKRDQEIALDQILFVDVGAEWDHYCADISRAFPLNSTFTERQAEIYDLVLEAQDSAIAQVKPGIDLEDVHQAANRVFKRAGYLDYFIHHTSHHLGLDVHDQADYNLPLEPGMVITIEPGIYIEEEGIGIRIEDDVLVTQGGSQVLSSMIPRDRKAVEAWMSGARGD